MDCIVRHFKIVTYVKYYLIIKSEVGFNFSYLVLFSPPRPSQLYLVIVSG